MSASTIAALELRQIIAARGALLDRADAFLRLLADEGVLDERADLRRDAQDLLSDIAAELVRRTT